jgi:hypothetical protein
MNNHTPNKPNTSHMKSEKNSSTNGQTLDSTRQHSQQGNSSNAKGNSNQPKCFPFVNVKHLYKLPMNE